MKKVEIGILAIMSITLMLVLTGCTTKKFSVLPNGEYTVNASWDWKTLSVNGDKYTLDNSREYEVLAQNDKNGIIVINGISDVNKKSTQIYKIIKVKNSYEWHTVANGTISEKAVAIVEKNK